MAEDPSNDPPIVPPPAELGAASDWDDAVAQSQSAPVDDRMARLKRQLATRRVVGDGQPADAGLSGLGLIMQLGAGAFFCLSVVAAIAGILTPAPSVLVLAGIAGAVRSSIHFRAGVELSRGRMDGLRPLRRYLVAALLHTIAAVALLVVNEVGLSMVVLGAVALMAWPLVLLVTWRRPSVRAVGVLSTQRPDPILPEDRGIQGLAALMSIMGLTGLIGVGLAAVVLFAVTQESGLFETQVPLTLYLLVAALLARSAVHATGGILLLRTPDADRLHRWASRYFTTGIISTIALIVHMFYSTPNIVVIIPMLPMAALAMLWPVIVRSYTDAVIPDTVWDAPSGPPITLAVDGGLSTIACFLLGGFTLSVTQTLMYLVPGIAPQADLLDGASGWLTVGGAVLTVWVCYEFLAGSKRTRIAAGVYAGVTVAASLYALSLIWGPFQAFDGEMGRLRLMLVFPMIMPLIAPVITLVAAFGPRPQRLAAPAVFD